MSFTLNKATQLKNPVTNPVRKGMKKPDINLPCVGCQKETKGGVCWVKWCEFYGCSQPEIR